MIKDFLNQIKKTVVFVGRPSPNKKDTQVVGTGVLVTINSLCYLATAKHVIFELDDNGNILRKRDDLCGIINTGHTRYTMAAIPFGTLEKNGATWLVDQKNSSVDLTLIPFDYNVADKDDIKADVNVIKDESFINPKLLYETLDVFYISYQPGLTNPTGDKKVAPIIRGGMISRINGNGTLYIDGFAFPGNSGSPVFDKASGNFVGIISDYLPFRDVARSDQTGLPRVIFEENTGLSRVWTTDFLQNIVDQLKPFISENPTTGPDVVKLPERKTLNLIDIANN